MCDYFAKWTEDGTWDRILEKLREMEREANGRNASPSECSVDSQTVKVSAFADKRGFDGGENFNGRKRQILVNTLGIIIAVVGTIGSCSDSEGAIKLLNRIRFSSDVSTLRIIHADGTYTGIELKEYLRDFRPGNPPELRITTRPPDKKGFVPIRKRWVVERTFAWLGYYRLLVRDYEKRLDNSESDVKAAMIHILLKRNLGRNKKDSGAMRQPIAA